LPAFAKFPSSWDLLVPSCEGSIGNANQKKQRFLANGVMVLLLARLCIFPVGFALAFPWIAAGVLTAPLVGAAKLLST